MILEFFKIMAIPNVIERITDTYKELIEITIPSCYF